MGNGPGRREGDLLIAEFLKAVVDTDICIYVIVFVQISLSFPAGTDIDKIILCNY